MNNQCFIIAEIGINHNGSLDISKKLIDIAVEAGCDAVKFQKRVPEICIPKELHNTMKDSPWGYINYLEYKKKMELGQNEYDEIDKYCKQKNIEWFASCWDIPSVDFIEQYEIIHHKIASACLTDDELVKYIKLKDKEVILSTGMSTMEQIFHAVNLLDRNKLSLLHTCSAYPSPNHELNLRLIPYLQQVFNLPIGYSGHELNSVPTIAAVVLGATIVERHITLDRSMWGADQSASLEPHDLVQLVKDIRAIEQAMGSNYKVVTEHEEPIIKKLRRV